MDQLWRWERFKLRLSVILLFTCMSQFEPSFKCSNGYIFAQNMGQSGKIVQRRLRQVSGFSNPIKGENDSRSHKASETPFPSPSPACPHLLSSAQSPFPSISVTPSPSVSPELESPTPSPSELMYPSISPNISPAPGFPPIISPIPDDPHHTQPAPWPSPASAPSQSLPKTNKSNNQLIFILTGVIGSLVFILVVVLCLAYCRRSKFVSVKPWATGLSGHLQKAFVAGVPKLQRSELETACEDFSNIIGSLSENTVYKGTLSSGVEIAVASCAIKSAEDWSNDLEAQFRNKIDILSKVNHKNFVNLIGYCEEEEPFTRMMVFEYAPYGTLYEHLHIKESEHLDWRTRLRIAVGMAYCLEYLQELRAPIALRDLQSSSVYLTEDYAAKIADFSFWNEVTATKKGAANLELLEITCADPETNVYNFGVILLEMITGRIPHSVSDHSLVDWALAYSSEGQPVKDIVDPTLTSFQEVEVKKMLDVVKACLVQDPKQRPGMREVTIKLKEITALEPDRATPKSSALWWAELEILSTDQVEESTKLFASCD